jgi:hypothetical protein
MLGRYLSPAQLASFRRFAAVALVRTTAIWPAQTGQRPEGGRRFRGQR